MYNTPDSIFFFGQDIGVAKYFSDVLLMTVDKVLLTALRINIESVTDASQLFWSLMGQLGGNFGAAIFDGTLRHGIFADSSFDKQIEALSGRLADLCPVKGMHDLTRVINGFGQDLIAFATTDHLQCPYIPFVQRFSGRREKSHSTQSFMSIFRIFGLHGALYLDCTLIRFVAENVASVLRSYQALAGEIESCKQQPLTLAKEPRVIEASKTFLSVAVALTLRTLVRQAAENCANETVPGIAQLVMTEAKRDTPLSHLFKEVLTSERSNFFIVEQLRTLLSTRFPHSLDHYFTFIAAMFGNPAWRTAKFDASLDAIENNLHVLPYAWELMVDLAPALFDRAGDAEVSLGIDAFFSSLSQIYKMSEGAGDSASGMPQLILVDKFTKLIPRLEYGYIEKYFPYGAVACGYPVTPLQKDPRPISQSRSAPAMPAPAAPPTTAVPPAQQSGSARYMGFPR
jgi:hypothetical protein